MRVTTFSAYMKKIHVKSNPLRAGFGLSVIPSVIISFPLNILRTNFVYVLILRDCYTSFLHICNIVIALG